VFIPSTDEEFVRRVLAQLAAAPAVQAEPGPDDWRRLIDKLARVRDAAPYVDGIGDHRWYYDAPVAEGAIEAIEARLGVALPADLRRFVGLFGDGAPGPFGRLRKLHEPGHSDALAGRAYRPVVTTASGRRVWWRDDAAVWCVPGTLKIGWRWTLGGEFVIDVSGPSPGCVGLIMTKRKVKFVASRLRFFAWYEGWLDEALAAAEAQRARLRQAAAEVERAPEDRDAWGTLACEAAFFGDWPRMREAVNRARALGATVLATPLVTTIPCEDTVISRLAVLLGSDYPLHPLAVPVLQMQLGAGLGWRGRHEEAIEVLRPLLTGDSEVARLGWVREALARSLSAVDRADEARAVLAGDGAGLGIAVSDRRG
jgi:hypothetical protein